MSKFNKRIKKKIKKSALKDLFNLYTKQPWLLNKEESLLELFSLCDTQYHKELISKLLEQFHFLDLETLSRYLNDIAHYIVENSKFIQDNCQIAAITYDDEADSSQKILDYIKMPLFKLGWDRLKSVNRYGAVMNNHKKGKTQIIFIDEFLGSGQTIIGRIKQLKSDLKEPFDLKLCFIAGMDFAVKKVEAEGYEVFCPLILPKGISESFSGSELQQSILRMQDLEGKLSSQINEYELSKYSFGYNKTEALYSMEGSLGNTPNSVFPIFWWPRSINDTSRKTLLTRFERGLK